MTKIKQIIALKLQARYVALLETLFKLQDYLSETFFRWYIHGEPERM